MPRLLFQYLKKAHIFIYNEITDSSLCSLRIWFCKPIGWKNALSQWLQTWSASWTDCKWSTKISFSPNSSSQNSHWKYLRWAWACLIWFRNASLQEKVNLQKMQEIFSFMLLPILVVPLVLSVVSSLCISPLCLFKWLCVI